MSTTVTGFIAKIEPKLSAGAPDDYSYSPIVSDTPLDRTWQATPAPMRSSEVSPSGIWNDGRKPSTGETDWTVTNEGSGLTEASNTSWEPQPGTSGATTNGAATDEATTDGTETNGAATDGATTDGTEKNGAVTDGATTDGASSTPTVLV